MGHISAFGLSTQPREFGRFGGHYIALLVIYEAYYSVILCRRYVNGVLADFS